jgi:cardiolipin synthase
MKKDILTIPNVMSGFRIVLIPLIVVSYLNEQFFCAAVILILSGLTDILDGYIARRFGQISDLGKILDPVADKLTQLAVAAVFVVKHPILLWLFIVLLIKELYMSVAGVILIRKGVRPFNSCWWGKLSTVLLYGYMILVVVFDSSLTEVWVQIGGIIVSGVLFFSMLKYLLIHRKILTSLKNMNHNTMGEDE